MTDKQQAPRLSLSHATLSAKNFDAALAFYCEVLGFHLTNQGEVPGGSRIAFISQDPANHHQIALVEAPEEGSHGFVMMDHLAFRTGTLDDLRYLHQKLIDAGIETILPINHGNAWSLYFNDPEGNGLECFVDTPFHVAQPFANGFDLEQSDAEISSATRALIESEPEFQSLEAWSQAFAEKLG